jgi:hypothetical protein
MGAIQAATTNNCLRKIGVLPVNRHVLREHDFVMQEAETTILDGEPSVSEIDADRPTKLPSAVVYSSHIGSLPAFPKSCHGILQVFSNRRYLSGIFCDLHKAFDHVKRTILTTNEQILE